MDSTTIALIALILTLIATIIGAFAFLMGENKKVAATARRDDDNNRDYLNGRIDGVARTLNERIEAFARTEAQERMDLRKEFVNSLSRFVEDLRRVSEAMVRRSDVDALESRLVRGLDKLESQIMTRRSGLDIRRGSGVDD